MTASLSVTVPTGSPGSESTRVFEQIARKYEDLRVTVSVDFCWRRCDQHASIHPATEHCVRRSEGGLLHLTEASS